MPTITPRLRKRKLFRFREAKSGQPVAVRAVKRSHALRFLQRRFPGRRFVDIGPKLRADSKPEPRTFVWQLSDGRQGGATATKKSRARRELKEHLAREVELGKPEVRIVAFYEKPSEGRRPIPQLTKRSAKKSTMVLSSPNIIGRILSQRPSFKRASR